MILLIIVTLLWLALIFICALFYVYKTRLENRIFNLENELDERTVEIYNRLNNVEYHLKSCE